MSATSILYQPCGLDFTYFFTIGVSLCYLLGLHVFILI